MKLRLGQPVNATDGKFGELGDIIVDPHTKTVTHLVVEPHKQHHQARLVPIGIVNELAGVLHVELDIVHLRRLEQVAVADYVPLGQPIELGDKWDVGTEDLLYTPYTSYDFDFSWYDDRVGISYDRIPKGDVEIRRSSEVATSDDHVVGQVDGLVADEDCITAVAVRVGVRGFRKSVMVPLDAVARVRTDRVELSISREQFDLVPRSDAMDEITDLSSRIHNLQERAQDVGTKFVRRGRDLIAKAKS